LRSGSRIVCCSHWAVSQDESLRQARLELEAARKRLAELIAAYDKDKRTALTWSQRQAKADAEAHVRASP
jgi:hypothetical protein